MSNHRLTDAIEATDPETKMWKSRFSAARGAYEKGEFRQCESLMLHAMEEAKKLKERTFATNTCHIGLGALYLAEGKLDDAQKQLDMAIGALSGSGEPALRELYAVALRFHAQVNADRDDTAGAENELEQAMEVLESIGTEGAVQLAYVISDLATLYVLRDNLSEAKELIFSAMDLLENSVGTNSPEYMRANMIYCLCQPQGDEDPLNQMEDDIVKMEYVRGQQHPSIVRAIRWYLKKRQDRGETDKMAEARDRFHLHATKLSVGY